MNAILLKKFVIPFSRDVKSLVLKILQREVVMFRTKLSAALPAILFFLGVTLPHNAANASPTNEYVEMGTA